MQDFGQLAFVLWEWTHQPETANILQSFLLAFRASLKGIRAEVCVLLTSAMHLYRCVCSQAVQKWRKYQNSPTLPEFWPLLLDTTALWFQWLYFFKNFMLLNKEVNSSKRCFTCQRSPNSCYRQYSRLIIIHERSTEPFFLFPQMLGKWLLSPELKGCLCKNKNPHYYLDGHYSQLFISSL